MYSQNVRFLNKIASKLNQFTREDDIYESEDKDTALYKLSRISALSEKLEFPEDAPIVKINVLQYFSEITTNINKASQILSLGDVDFESEYKILRVLNETRGLVNGLGLYLELISLAPDDDIPEHIYESFEPFVDVESGECHEPKNIELQSAILNILHGARDTKGRQQEEKEVAVPFDSVIAKLTNLNLEVDADLVVDFGGGMTGYAREKTGISADLERMRSACAHYFEPTHQKRSGKIAEAAETIYNAKNSGVTNLKDVSSGEFIIAASEALRSVFLLNEPLNSYEEQISWQELSLSARRMPSDKNRGNLLIRNLGRYGSKPEGAQGKKGILDDFSDVIKHSGEDRLIYVMRTYGSKPYTITCAILKLPETSAGKKILAKFQQSLFLIFCAEIFRYFPIEGLDACTQSKKMPFALALGLGLELLEDGHITLDEMFDKDAAYGLPTGSKILDSATAIGKKTVALLQKYQTCLKENTETAGTFLNAYPKGYIAQDEQTHVGRLEETYGYNLKR